jgi:beta-barrel assembly-enhancing protease
MLKIKFVIILFTIFYSGILFSNSVFVQSPIAKLLVEPNVASAGKPLKAGLELQQIGEQDMFLKVKSGSDTGWVMKLYVSKIPPSAKVTNAGNQDKTGPIQSRARASTFTETASARGLSESKKLRTRGNNDEYDFETLDWLDKVKVKPEDIEKFKEE